MNIMMGNMIKVARTVVPKAVDNGEVFKVSPGYVEQGFREGEGGMDDDMEGYKDERGINFSPLKVMFRTGLNGRGGSEAEGYNRSVNRTVTKLAFSSICLKGP